MLSFTSRAAVNKAKLTRTESVSHHNIHTIFGLIELSKTHKILLIGCAGGTLASVIARAAKNVTVIDVNPASFPLAKQYFSLPNNVRCQFADEQWISFENCQSLREGEPKLAAAIAPPASPEKTLRKNFRLSSRN